MERTETIEEAAKRMPSADQLRRKMERDMRRMVKAQRRMLQRPRQSKHQPGTTKALVEDRAAVSRKRNKAAKASRRKNR